ncbi:hypothetical protein I3843_02G166700 [Carya illinoinensis]|nr:hypothetical protein I3760_02G190300 [Carya illinoinensis]KAG7993207.1 hypothetical protein I3843_02G166700 [Carya illinoinensis]
MATSRPPPQKRLDLELTIVSAKHLKNVNWKNKDLKPYASFTFPLTNPVQDFVLTLEIFHSKPSKTPMPLVGTLRVPLKDLANNPDDPIRIKTFQLTRPSVVRERPLSLDYHVAPQPSYYYSGATTLPPHDYKGYSPYTLPLFALSPLQPSPVSYLYSSDPNAYSGYYIGYYSSAPPPPIPPRPFFDQPMNYGGPGGPNGPSAVDYSGLGTGLAMGAVVGALGGLALEEGLKYEQENIMDRVENDVAARDDYSDY